MTHFAVPPPTDDDYPKAATAPLLGDEETPLPQHIVARFNVMKEEECGDRLVAAGVYGNGLVDGYREAWREVEAKIASGELITKDQAWEIHNEGARQYGILKREYEEFKANVIGKMESGELMVVKTIRLSDLNEHIRKEHDIAWNAAGSGWVTHCAGCGAKIIEG